MASRQDMKVKNSHGCKVRDHCVLLLCDVSPLRIDIGRYVRTAQNLCSMCFDPPHRKYPNKVIPRVDPLGLHCKLPAHPRHGQHSCKPLSPRQKLHINTTRQDSIPTVHTPHANHERIQQDRKIMHCSPCQDLSIKPTRKNDVPPSRIIRCLTSPCC